MLSWLALAASLSIRYSASALRGEYRVRPGCTNPVAVNCHYQSDARLRDEHEWQTLQGNTLLGFGSLQSVMVVLMTSQSGPVPEP